MRPDKETLARLYVEQRMTTREIAAIYGVDKISVCRWLAKYGIPKRAAGRGLAHRGVEPPTADELDRLLNVERIGYRGVAARYGVDFTAVTHWCKRLNVRSPTVWETRYGPDRPSWPSADALLAEYESGVSVREIADRLGVTHGTVVKRLRALGAEIRRNGWDNGKRFVGADGHVVRSTYERRVCDALSEQGIPHAYEPRLPWDRRSCADFLANGWYVEIWGVTRSPVYVERRRRKLAAYRAHNAALVEIHDWDFSKQKRGRWRRLLGATSQAPQ